MMNTDRACLGGPLIRVYQCASVVECHFLFFVILVSFVVTHQTLWRGHWPMSFDEAHDQEPFSGRSEQC